MTWLKAAVLVLVLSISACGGHEEKGAGKGAPGPTASAKKALAPVAAGDLRVDTAASFLSLAIDGGGESGSKVEAKLTLRDGRLSLGGGVPVARFSIDLTSFDSHLPMRNDRVKTYFFEVGNPDRETAEVVITRLPEEALAKLREKKMVTGVTVDVELTLSGRTFTLPLKFDAGYTERGTLWVKSSGPLDLDIRSLGMHDKRRQLIQICQHDRIADLVKADVSLEFAAK
jgi:hypothetical protein